MKCENEKLGCSFEVPERITVREQLHYWSAIGFETEEPPLVRRWQAGKALIQNWQCEGMPDPQTSLDELYDPRQTQIVLCASSEIWHHLNRLESVPKN